MKHSHRRINTRKLLNWLALACIAGVFFAYSLPGSAKEVEEKHVIVTAVTGDVTYIRPSESVQPQAVTPFMELEEGDTITLPLDSHMNVLFISRGLGETWQGPKTLLFQEGYLLAQTHGTWKRDRPKLLKSLLFEPQKILNNSPLVPLIGKVTRPIPPDVDATIQKTYSILRKEFGDEDATPELYRLSMLAEYGQYSGMLPLLQKLLNSFPENPILLKWQEWVESRSGQ